MNYERQPAVRVLAEELSDATADQYQKHDADRAPRFSVLPSGREANRVLIAGTLTEVDDVGSDTEYFQARVVDPTGTAYVYAGQYQQESRKVLRELEPPEYVMVSGKIKTFEKDDGNTNVYIAPELVVTIDEDKRNQTLFVAAKRTLEGLQSFDESSSVGERVIEAYQDEEGLDLTKYKQAAVTTLAHLTDSDGDLSTTVDDDDDDGPSETDTDSNEDTEQEDSSSDVSVSLGSRDDFSEATKDATSSDTSDDTDESDDDGERPPVKAGASVDAIHGVGDHYAELLKQAGIETVGEFAAADIELMAEQTEIAGSRLEAWAAGLEVITDQAAASDSAQAQEEGETAAQTGVESDEDDEEDEAAPAEVEVGTIPGFGD